MDHIMGDTIKAGKSIIAISTMESSHLRPHSSDSAKIEGFEPMQFIQCFLVSSIARTGLRQKNDTE